MTSLLYLNIIQIVWFYGFGFCLKVSFSQEFSPKNFENSFNKSMKLFPSAQNPGNLAYFTNLFAFCWTKKHSAALGHKGVLQFCHSNPNFGLC